MVARHWTKGLLLVSFLAESAMGSTRSRCERDLREGGWTVMMSQKYSEVELAGVLACIVATEGAGTLACLGSFAQDVAQEFGPEIIATTIKHRGEIFTAGNLVFDAGVCERSYTITEWPKIKGFDRYFYLRYKARTQHNPREPLHDPRSQEGLYTAANTVWYSNGQGGYCGFISEEHFNIASGNYAEALRNKVPMSAFDGLQNDGQCRIPLPAGTFKHAGSSRVFYSNGNGAYCRMGHEHDNGVPMFQYGFDITPATSFHYAGNCG
jgi:hypothetical protein